MERFREFFCKLNILRPLTPKDLLSDEPSPHIQLQFSNIYCVCALQFEIVSGIVLFPILSAILSVHYCPLNDSCILAPHFFPLPLRLFVTY